MRVVWRLIRLSWWVALAACGGGGGGGSEGATVQVRFEVLSSGTYAGRYAYQRVRILREGVSAAYAIWFPPPEPSVGERGPAVLLSDPYGGIDWTGEAVDIAARQMAGSDGFVMLPDQNGPRHPDGIGLFVPYDHSPIEVAGGHALAYLINKVGVLLLYQRTYAGGDLQDDIDDVVSALSFLNQDAQVDRRRIGAWGSSWGGSLQLHGMAQAPSAQRPSVASISTPIIDFEQYVGYADWLGAVHTDAGQAVLRLQPFAVRARAAAARAENPDGLARYAAAPLLANRQTRILFLHDLFDTVAPLIQANTLYFGTPGFHQVFLFPHQNETLEWTRLEVAHAPLSPGFDEASSILFSQAYLLLRLLPDAATVQVPRLGDVEALFPYLRQQQLAGADLNAYLKPRLLELCNAKLKLVRYEDEFKSSEDGREFVARMLRTHWGYEVSAAQVVAFLNSHGL